MFCFGVEMKKILSSLCLALALLIGQQAQAADDAVVIATNPTWPPMEFVDMDKKIVGFEIDLLDAICEAAGIKATWKNAAWEGIFGEIESHNADIIASCVTITEARQKKYLFSEPIYNLVQALVVLNDSTIAKPEDLGGKKVGIQIGTTATEALKKIDTDLEIVTYDEVGLALEDLANGRLDAVMCDDPVAKYYASQKEGYQGKMKIAFSSGDPEIIGFLVLKERTELMDKLSAGFKAIKENGKEKEIYTKWFGNF